MPRAPFDGPFPDGGDLSGSRAPVLGVVGGLDTRGTLELGETES
jgi:hypothetical protein